MLEDASTSYLAGGLWSTGSSGWEISIATKLHLRMINSFLYPLQVGFGLYPVIVKKFASKKNASPLTFSFYRDFCCTPLLFLCALIVERKIMFPRPKMLLVC